MGLELTPILSQIGRILFFLVLAGSAVATLNSYRGIPLVVIREKSELSFGMGASIFVIFGYYAFIKFGQSLGFKGIVSPLLSAWIGNIIFFYIGLVLFWKSKT